MPRNSLTLDKLSKDINFFDGYCAEILVDFYDKSTASIINFVSKYEQEDCNIVMVDDDDEVDQLFHIYASGVKQLNTLCDIMSNDFDVIDLELKSLSES
tara:strand:- start:1346 stop:1642 length:297 start_codon:yes stop_codon:yes gene_type:complete